MLDLYKRPDRAKELLEINTLSRIYYGIARVHAGTDPTSSGGAVSVEVWEEFGLPCTKRVVQALKKMGVRVTIYVVIPMTGWRHSH